MPFFARHSAPAALALGLLLLPSCVGLSPSKGSPASTLGPGSVTETRGESLSLAKAEAGASWLWAAYTALKGKGGDSAALGELRLELGDLEAAIKTGNLSLALARYQSARARVTAVAGGSGA